MTLRTRLTLLFSLLCSGILIISFGLIYYFSSSYLQEEYLKRISDKAVTAAVLLLKVDAVDSALLKIIDRSKQDNLHLENITVFDPENKEIYTNNDTVFFRFTTDLFREIRAKEKIAYQEDGFDVVGFTFPQAAGTHIVIAGAVDLQRPHTLRQLRNLLFFLGLGLVAIVTLAGWIYAGRALSPIKKVIRQIEGLSSTDLSKRLDQHHSPDEIGTLITIFNNLLARLESAFTLQKTFVANVSHELKNPLTKITSQLEVITLKERNSEEYLGIIKSVLDDVRELNHLSNSLLDLATLNDDQRSFTMSNVRLDEVIWDAREKALAMNQKFEVEVTIDKMPETETRLIVLGNPYLLRTAFINLIENACKFSPDGRAEIALLWSESDISIRILNRGIGVPKTVIAKVFQPFYRANPTSAVKGYGIGLPLAEKIIAIHKGTLEMESIPNESTVVTVAFKSKPDF
jgi:signal transduction histidine kinase